MHIAFALPGRADTGGGGLAYAEAMAAALRAMGHAARVTEDDDPAWAPGAVPVIDGLLLPRLLPRLDALAEAGAVALIHHALARAGRDAGQRTAVADAMRAMLPRLRRIIATSRPVADRLMREFGLAAVDVVEPGAHDLPRNAAGDGTCRILSVGVLTPRKGHDALLRALARLGDLDWTLTIAGAAGRDPDHAAHLAALIPDLGLAGRVRLLADPDGTALDALWREAHLFALATRWEGYPAAVAEALRRGIPVVVTEGDKPGGVGAMVPAGAGAVCVLEDEPTLSKCLRRLVFDAGLRAEMAEGAWRAGQSLPGWPAQAALLERVLGG
jgi:glycosyltransferase involved in cell wall biosynthesis